MKNEAIREELIGQAETCFIALMTQLDVLFDIAGIYLDLYPNETPSIRFKNLELKKTVDNIAETSRQLADTIKKLKHGEPRLLSRLGTEIHVLNELWANVQALVYFLVSHEISLDGFDAELAAEAFHQLVKCNQLLT